MGKGADKPEPTAQENALAEISKNQLARYEATFAPFEDEWLKESRVTAGEKERLSGHIAGDVAQTFSTAEKKLTGMNPASGNFAASARDLAVGKGRAGARAMAEGNLQAENADVAALMDGVKMGRGEAIESQAGMEEMASLATSKAINEAFTDQSNRDATAGMVGSAIGVAGYGATKFGSGMKPMTDSQGGEYLANASGVRVKPIN
jgi:hypothetical protein